MILYNFRYRGPYEYDKYILNAFQFYNTVKKLTEKLDDAKKALIDDPKANSSVLYNELTKENSINIQILKQKFSMR